MRIDPTPPHLDATSPSRGGTHRRLLVWSAFVLVAAVLAVALLTDGRRPVEDLTVGDVVRVGVFDGDSIPDYLRSSRAELAELVAEASRVEPVEIYALVAFTSYLTPDQLGAVLSDVAVSEAIGRVPLPDTQTQIVRIATARIPADVAIGMTEIAERKDREAQDYRDRSGALNGGDRELRQLYDHAAEVADAEASAYRAYCACIYAAVVRAAPPELKQLESRTEVRVIDPAAELRRLDRAVFLPPLPEQADMVRPVGDDLFSDADGSGGTGGGRGPGAGGMAQIGFPP
ncbi:MAG TPA: hypothetical protein VFX60_08850 [Micromonospora sp.]|nr:hypothetical protein [Micromonospora sp.]